jgi:hypothetical protein
MSLVQCTVISQCQFLSFNILLQHCKMSPLGRKQGMVVHTCNPSTWETEAGGWQAWGPACLYSKTLAQNQINKQTNNNEKKDVTIGGSWVKDSGDYIFGNFLWFYFYFKTKSYKSLMFIMYSFPSFICWSFIHYTNSNDYHFCPKKPAEL